MASGFVEILIKVENEVDVIEEVHNPGDCEMMFGLPLKRIT